MKITNKSIALSAGFSLIEVMIVVAIVGILSAIAMPAYQDYVTRGKFPEATSVLASKRVQMEQYFQDNKTYVGAPPCVAENSNKYFDFDCAGAFGVAPTANAYTIEAVGKGSMAGFAFTIDQSNAKTTAAAAAGWSQHAPNNCWIVKRSGDC